MGHAWLELDGWIYDPVLDRAMRCDVYADLYKAVVFNRYTFLEANMEIVKSGHHGPW